MLRVLVVPVELLQRPSGGPTVRLPTRVPTALAPASARSGQAATTAAAATMTMPPTPAAVSKGVTMTSVLLVPQQQPQPHQLPVFLRRISTTTWSTTKKNTTTFTTDTTTKTPRLLSAVCRRGIRCGPTTIARSPRGRHRCCLVTGQRRRRRQPCELPSCDVPIDHRRCLLRRPPPQQLRSRRAWGRATKRTAVEVCA